MAHSVLTHLMFEGNAETAMTFYVSLFRDAGVQEIERYGPAGPGKDGSIKVARFTLAGREFLCIDSPAPHAFSFTPAMSLFVECEDDAELSRVFAALAKGGEVLMPLGDYGFSTRFGWLADRFGVSWQLNLA